jgi:hypothetical protein
MPLPHGVTDPALTYSMPDPDALLKTYEAAYSAHYYERRTLTDEQIAVVLMLAGGYLDLTLYALGQECCVGKLRDIWRARRAAGEEKR